MKRIWIWLALLAAVAAFGLFPAQGTDAADLLPAQLLLVEASGGTLRLETDQGSVGFGKTLGEAMDDLLQIRLAIREGNWSLIAGLADDMLTALNRYGALTDSEEEIEAALDAAEQERQSLLTGTKTTLSNQLSSAYYYDHTEVDGYETLFTAHALQNLTAESFAELKASEPTSPEGQFVVGKLCSD